MLLDNRRIEMTDDMLHVMKWHNGEKEYSPFSDAEMKRRQGGAFYVGPTEEPRMKRLLGIGG